MSTAERAFLIAQIKIKRIKYKQIATEFDLSQAYVSDILSGRKDGPKAMQWITKFDSYIGSIKREG